MCVSGIDEGIKCDDCIKPCKSEVMYLWVSGID